MGTPGTDPCFDQSQPVKPGYFRVPDFVDVAVYDDALFQEYTKGDRFWEFILNFTPGHRNPVHREAHFNTDHFESSIMARRWNFFVEQVKSGQTPAAARALMREKFKFD